MKKIIAALMILVLCTSISAHATNLQPISEIVIGDVNIDNKISLTDAIMIFRHFVKRTGYGHSGDAIHTTSGDELWVGDVNFDGRIGLEDTILLLRYMAKDQTAISECGKTFDIDTDNQLMQGEVNALDNTGQKLVIENVKYEYYANTVTFDICCSGMTEGIAGLNINLNIPSNAEVEITDCTDMYTYKNTSGKFNISGANDDNIQLSNERLMTVTLNFPDVLNEDVNLEFLPGTALADIDTQTGEIYEYTVDDGNLMTAGYNIPAPRTDKFTFITKEATNITSNSATLNGHYDIERGNIQAGCGVNPKFVLWKKGDEENIKSYGDNSYFFSSSDISYDVAGLEPDSEYAYYITRYDDSTEKGETIEFRTQSTDGKTALHYGNCGEKAKWVLYSTGEFVISGTGAMDNYASYKGMPWYEYANDITNIKVKYGITNVGDFAFYGLTNLQEVILEESVTHIGEAAFSGCEGLISVKMPVELESIGRGAFRDCTALSEIHISNGVTELKDNTLYGCAALQKVYMPKTLISIGNSVFYGCEVLDTVYYGGTEDNFYNNMEIGVNNMPLLQAYPECSYSEALPTYTISYYFDNKDTPDEIQTKNYNETINITNTIPTKENYTFIGWSTKNNAQIAEYTSGSEYKENVDTVLYAVWEKNLYTVTSSLPSGAYFDNGVSVKKFYLSCNNSEAVIYYTTDGSEPTNQSTLYTESGIVLSGNMILKAVAYVNGELSSNIAGYKYIYDKNLYITEKAAFEPVNIEVGDDLLSVLPKTVKLKTSNNDTVNATITWDTTGSTTDTARSFTVSGTAAAADSKYIWFDEEYKNVIISVTVFGKAVPPEPDVFFGDINGDGEINMKDATRLLKYLSSWEVEIIEKGSDLNADGKINMKDATRLLKHLAGWDGELGVK